MKTSKHSSRSGLAMVAVTVVSLLSSMIVVSLLYRLRVENFAADTGNGSRQAWEVAKIGLYRAADLVRRDWANTRLWMNNPGLFKSQFVQDDGRDRWYFTIYVPGDEDKSLSNGVSERHRHGLRDESARFNLFGVDSAIVENIPGMTPDAVADLETRLGPPVSEGSFLAAPYEPAFALAGTRGARVATMADLSRQADSPRLEGFYDQLALETYLTTFGVRSALDGRGRLQIDINHDVENLARLDVPNQAIEYIAAERRVSESPIAFGHPIELLGAEITVNDANGDEKVLESGINVEHLDELLDRCTAVPYDRYIDSTVNVNTASARVLALVPGIDESLAQSIVTTRTDLSPEDRRSAAWLVESGLMTVEDFKTTVPWLCARGFQYRLRVVGFGLPSGIYRVLEAVVDVSRPRTRIVFLRDLSRDGLPFSIQPSHSEREVEI